MISRSIPSKQNQKAAGRNSQAGSALLLAVGGLFVLAGIVGTAALVVVHAQAVAYYQTKLSFIANEGAVRASSELEWAAFPRPGGTMGKATTEGEAVIRDLLSENGLPQADNIVIERHADGQGVSATVSVRGLAMPGNGGVLPSFLNLTVSGHKRFDEDRPPTVFSFRANGVKVSMPCWGADTSPVNTGLPLDKISRQIRIDEFPDCPFQIAYPVIGNEGRMSSRK